MRLRTIAIGLGWLASQAIAVDALSGGPPASTVKSEDGCSCHSQAPNSKTEITVKVDASSQPSPYTPNKDYTVTITSKTDVINAGPNKGGFLSYVTKGTLSKPSTHADWYQTGTVDGLPFIEHTLAGDQGNTANDQPWTFTWKSPAKGSGSVTLKVYVNRVNGDGTNSDLDHWNRATLTITEAPSPTTTSTSTTSTKPGPTTTKTSSTSSTTPGPSAKKKEFEIPEWSLVAPLALLGTAWLIRRR